MATVSWSLDSYTLTGGDSTAVWRVITRSVADEKLGTARVSTTPRLDGFHVALALPLADGCLPGFDLPLPRGRVVVTEALVERSAEHLVGVEGMQGAFERPGQLQQSRLGVGVALNGRRRAGLTTDAVRGRCDHGRQRKVGVRVGAWPSALQPAELRVRRMNDGSNRGRAILDAPTDIDGGEPPGNEPLVGVDGGIEQQRRRRQVIEHAGDRREKNRWQRRRRRCRPERVPATAPAREVDVPA